MRLYGTYDYSQYSMFDYVQYSMYLCYFFRAFIHINITSFIKDVHDLIQKLIQNDW